MWLICGQSIGMADVMFADSVSVGNICGQAYAATINWLTTSITMATNEISCFDFILRIEYILREFTHVVEFKHVELFNVIYVTL